MEIPLKISWLRLISTPGNFDISELVDQVGCLKILVSKLTMDGRLKDAEIARLNAALSAHEV